MSYLAGCRAVFERELRGYFATPLGYVFVVIFLISSGYLTVSRDFGRFLEIREANLDAFFGYVPWIFVVLVPAVAMRLWAEERKSGTIELLLTLPISLPGAYLGKFLRTDLFVREDLVDPGPLHVEDLPLQRQDSLEGAVPPLLRAASRTITLDQIDLA